MSGASLAVRRFLIASALVAGSVTLGLGVLEAALRLFYPMSDFLWQWDTKIGMKLIPGKEGRSVKPGLFDVKVTINDEGFRDRTHARTKPPGTQRVVLLGDSFVEAIQVPFEESITAVLEERLTASTGTIETMNFAVSGSGTAVQYLALREYGLPYQPDLVLLFLVGNDISDNSVALKGAPYLPYARLSPKGALLRNAAGEPLFSRFEPPAPVVAIPETVKQNWKTYRFVRQLADQAAPLGALLKQDAAPPGLGYYELYRAPPAPVWAEAWNTTEQLLVATRDLAHAHKAKFAVVLVPAAWEVYPELWKKVSQELDTGRASLDSHYPSARLAAFLRANDITVVELLEEFRRRALELPPLYIPRDAHWTSEGHRLAGEIVAKRVATLLGGR